MPAPGTYLFIARRISSVHVEENRRALDLRLTAEDLAEIDRAFPAPSEPQPLEIL